MKKLLVLFCLITTCVLATGCSAKSGILDVIPYEVQVVKKQKPSSYKVAVEKLLATGVLKAKQESDESVKEAKALYEAWKDPSISEQRKNEISMEIEGIFERGMDAPEFYLYVDIEKLTQAYYNIPDEQTPATDYSGAIYEFMEPYLKDNNVDVTPLYELAKYVEDNVDTVSKYYEATRSRYD